jgi:hypothetical protein
MTTADVEALRANPALLRGRRGAPPRGVTDVDRFWSYVDVTPYCWEWAGLRDRDGYGESQHAGRKRKAHRVAYELLVGPILKGSDLDHLCRNKRCVNPDHLEPVTKAENNRRARATRTHCPQGHERTPENTYTRKDTGATMCYRCVLERGRARNAQT